jgi:hypothetical protein
MLRTVCILILAAIIWWLWPDPGLRHPPGVIAPAIPAQEMIPPKSLPDFKGYKLQAVATYAMHARVLHTKHYWVGGNDLVPYDVALGWGRMSDQKVLDRLDISQTNRFFFYQWKGEAPIPPGEIIRSASNNHVISANSTVAKAVSHLRPGQLVAMRGYLVNATGPDGSHWNTSLTRDDTGNGACELFYVEEIIVSNDPLPAEYQKLVATAKDSAAAK